jgi:hypothetical protein
MESKGKSSGDSLVEESKGGLPDIKKDAVSCYEYSESHDQGDANWQRSIAMSSPTTAYPSEQKTGTG